MDDSDKFFNGLTDEDAHNVENLRERLLQGEPLSRFQLLWLIAEDARERGDREVAIRAFRLALAEVGIESPIDSETEQPGGGETEGVATDPE